MRNNLEGLDKFLETWYNKVEQKLNQEKGRLSEMIKRTEQKEKELQRAIERIVEKIIHSGEHEAKKYELWTPVMSYHVMHLALTSLEKGIELAEKYGVDNAYEISQKDKTNLLSVIFEKPEKKIKEILEFTNKTEKLFVFWGIVLVDECGIDTAKEALIRIKKLFWKKFVERLWWRTSFENDEIRRQAESIAEETMKLYNINCYPVRIVDILLDLVEEYGAVLAEHIMVIIEKKLTGGL